MNNKVKIIAVVVPFDRHICLYSTRTNIIDQIELNTSSKNTVFFILIYKRIYYMDVLILYIV